jgi:hypothetical protein
MPNVKNEFKSDRLIWTKHRPPLSINTMLTDDSNKSVPVERGTETKNRALTPHDAVDLPFASRAICDSAVSDRG